MFVPDDARLVWNSYHDIRILVEDNALAGQSALDARIDGAVDKVLLLVGDFLQMGLAFFHINMTGGASAYTATVVVEVDIGLLGDFEDRGVQKFTRHLLGGDIGIFKLKSNCSHKTGAKVAQFLANITELTKYCSLGDHSFFGVFGQN